MLRTDIMPSNVFSLSNPLTIICLLLLTYLGIAFTFNRPGSSSNKSFFGNDRRIGIYSHNLYEHDQRRFQATREPQYTDQDGNHIYSARDLKPRYSGPTEQEMTPEQRKIRDAILASRPRTGLSGPFGPWLAVPQIAGPAQELGKACRYDTSLSFRESELVILLTGARMRSHAEFDIHVDEALKAGLSMEIITAIPRDHQFSLTAVRDEVVPLLDVPDNEHREREKAIVLFTAKLLDDCTVSDRQYETTKRILGGKDEPLVEITSIVGYYTYVAFTLNVFQLPSGK